jgi:flavodoxin
MKAVVVYESMFGNTHLVAEAIGSGFGQAIAAEIVVVPVGDADQELLGSADVIVVGEPTHAHGMSRTTTRAAAVDQARQSDGEFSADPDAEGPGFRDWFESLGTVQARAAFDTRFKAPAALTGRASKRIARELVHHGCTLIADPESFLVTKDNHLEADEQQRAREWGARLAARMQPATPLP